MPLTKTLRTLLASAAATAHDQSLIDARRAARAVWAKQAFAAFMEAQARVTDAWERIFDELPDDLSDEEVEALPEPHEQAEAEALYAPIRAILDRDRWPRELHFKDV